LDRTPRLYVVANGHGGPCLDLSRVPSALADATVGVDLLVIEGMGRAVHTNLYAQFKCDCLKLAMIKTERIAYKLFGGGLYDCMCRFQPAPPASTWSSGNGGTPARAGGSSSSSSGAGAAAGTWGGPAWQQQQHRTSSS
jgi:type II pantothenate kinase